MGPYRRKILIYFGIILCLNAAIPCFGSKIIRTSAKSLAEKAGAAQYAVHIEEELTSEEIGKKHDLSKRRTSAFDDTDYEVYQGVVGRPGIDFPILSGIPQTTFNCRKFGNGYFADLETDCQVFHICEAGKKISFLCPNGTIFQQSDLICDWWFKVNCAASPGHYAESSEILSRAQKRPHLIPQTGSVENISESRESFEEKSQYPNRKEEIRKNQQKKLKSRNKETFDDITASGENFDFEDISVDSRKSNGRSRQSSRKSTRISHRNAKELSDDFLESQEVAESASFVLDRQNSFNGYHYEPPKQSVEFKTQTSSSNNSTRIETSQNQSVSQNSNNTFTGYIYDQPDRNSRRLESVTTRPDLTSTTTIPFKDMFSPSTSPRRGSISYQNGGSPNRQERKQNSHSSPTPNSIITDEVKSTTSLVTGQQHPSTYTTARRLETSRTTPFYTPTVPSLIYRAPTINSNIDSQTQLPSTPSTPSVSEHAMEMIRTIHELHLNNPTPTIASERPISGSRPGLIIPPSSGPDTLHSLALYFATAVDNLMTNPENQTSTSPPLRNLFDNLDVQVGNVTKISSSHVSNQTIEKYEKLFGIENDPVISRSALSNRMDSGDDTKFTSADNDLETEYSNNPVLGAAGTPQIRELAQVFTHALSAYLHDPSTFRRVLSEIRPTEPTSIQNSEDLLSNRIGRTKDFNKGTGPTYLPTVATTSATATTTFISTTEDFEVLDFSDVTISTAKKELNYPSTTPSTTNPTTTEFPSTTTNGDTETSTVLSNIIQDSLNNADRVPASRFLTELLLKSPESREPKQLQTTTDSNNPFALEINGGLVMSTSFPYFQDDSRESSKQSLEDSSYFPLKKDLENRLLLNPYGHDVNRNSSLINDTYPTALSDIQAIPLKWGDEITEDTITQTTTDYPAALSFDLLPPSAAQKGFSLPNIEHLRPKIDENDLQRAQSQSLIASGNQILDEQKGKSFTTVAPRFGDKTTTDAPTVTTIVNGHFITHDYRTSTESAIRQSKSTIPDTGKFSTNPWSTLAYTVFLDPLTINDGLLDSAKLKDVTPSPNTYLPRSTQTTPYSASTTSIPYVTTDFSEPAVYPLRGLFNRNNLNNGAREGKLLESSTYPTTLRDKPEEYVEVMQKKANEMFGNLNDTSATHLLNVMKKANKNKTVRKLILLLIQTCDDDYNTTVEESRTALLNALIGMDGKIDDESDFQVINARPNRRGKNIARFDGNSVTEPTSTETPITTFRRPLYNGGSSTTIAPQYLFESTTNNNESPTTNTITTSNPSFDDFSTTSISRAKEGYGIYFRTDDAYSTTSEGLYSPEPTDQTTFTSFDETTTLASTTTTTTSTTTRPITPLATNTNIRTRSAQSRRIAKDLDDLLGQSSQNYDPNSSRTHKHSDTRALDLLRSLYSLAGRFGR